MLHVRSLEVGLDSANISHRGRRNYRKRGPHWNGLIHRCKRNADRLEIRRIQRLQLNRTVWNLLVINAVTSADRRRSFSERIPSEAETRSKVVFRSVINVFSPRRTSWRAVECWWPCLDVLRILNYAIAKVSRTRYPISGSSHLRRSTGAPQRRIEIGQ